MSQKTIFGNLFIFLVLLLFSACNNNGQNVSPNTATMPTPPTIAAAATPIVEAVMSAVATPTPPVITRMPGNEGPNGGDRTGIQFTAMAQTILEILQRDNGRVFPELTVADFTRAIRQTRVLVHEKIFVNGDERDAINNGVDLIEVSSSRWAAQANQTFDRLILTMHEYLGILDLEHDNYAISTRLRSMFANANTCSFIYFESSSNVYKIHAMPANSYFGSFYSIEQALQSMQTLIGEGRCLPPVSQGVCEIIQDTNTYTVEVNRRKMSPPFQTRAAAENLTTTFVNANICSQ